ncbi:MAG: hypothetical protein WBF08_00040 [Candidatus Bathyarchaeia archaeon]
MFASLIAPPSTPPPSEDWISFDFYPSNGIVVTEDRRWLTITFNCEGAGTSTILVEGTVDLATGTEAPQTVDLEPIEITVNQVGIPVGGIASPINKLEILIPYIALVGLIITVSIVYVLRRRKD